MINERIIILISFIIFLMIIEMIYHKNKKIAITCDVFKLLIELILAYAYQHQLVILLVMSSIIIVNIFELIFRLIKK